MQLNAYLSEHFGPQPINEIKSARCIYQWTSVRRKCDIDLHGTGAFKLRRVFFDAMEEPVFESD